MRTVSKPWRAPCGCTATLNLAFVNGPEPASSSITGVVACIRHAKAADPIKAALAERQGKGV